MLGMTLEKLQDKSVFFYRIHLSILFILNINKVYSREVYFEKFKNCENIYINYERLICSISWKFMIKK